MKNNHNIEGGVEIVQDPKAEIMAILAEIQTMGNNDHEVSSIQDILGRLESGEIEVEEAVEEAQAIRDQKIER